MVRAPRRPSARRRHVTGSLARPADTRAPIRNGEGCPRLTGRAVSATDAVEPPAQDGARATAPQTVAQVGAGLTGETGERTERSRSAAVRDAERGRRGTDHERPR